VTIKVENTSSSSKILAVSIVDVSVEQQMLTHEKIYWSCVEIAFSVKIWVPVRCPRPCENVLTVKN